MLSLDLLIQGLETFILGCETALGGCVDDEDDFVLVVGEGDRLAFLYGGGEVVSSLYLHGIWLADIQWRGKEAGLTVKRLEIVEASSGSHGVKSCLRSYYGELIEACSGS